MEMKRMKTSKRILSVIMAAFMMIGIVSAGLTAFAAEPTLQQLIDAAGDGDTVVLAKHTGNSSVVIENKNIILDLQGYTLAGSYGQSAITVINSNVTIKNGHIYSYFAKVSTVEMLNTVADSAYSKPTIDIRSGNVSIYGLFVDGMQIRIPTTNTYSYVPVSSAVYVAKNAYLTVEKSALIGIEWGLHNAAGSHVTVIDGAFIGVDKGIKREADVVYNSAVTSRVSAKDKIENIFTGFTLEPNEKSFLSSLLGDRAVAYVKDAVPNVEATFEDGDLTVIAYPDVSNVIAEPEFSYKWIPDTVKVGTTEKRFQKVAGMEKYIAVFSDVTETAAGSVDTLDVGYRIWLGLDANEISILNNLVSTVKGVYEDIGPWLEDGYEDLIETYNDYIDVFASLYNDIDTLAAQMLPGSPPRSFGDIEEFKNLQIDLYLIGGETMYNRIKETIDSSYVYNDYAICTYVFGIEPGQPKLIDEIEAFRADLEAVDFNDYADLLFFFYDNYERIVDIVELADNYGSKLVTDLNSEMASTIIDALGELGNGDINYYVDLAEDIVGYLDQANDLIAEVLEVEQINWFINYVDTNRAQLEIYADKAIDIIENLETYFNPYVKDGWLMMYANIYEVEYQAFNPVKADVRVNGTGKVEYASEYDSGETINGIEASYYPNTDITLTAVETSPEVEFLYWVNPDSNRILSTEPVCTVSTNINTRIEAVFNDASLGYQVAYANTTGDIEGVEFYNPTLDNYVYVTTAIPYMPRYEFVGWPRAISDGSGNYIIPVADLNTYKSPFAGSIKTSAFDEVSDKYENAIVPVRSGSDNYIVVPQYNISGSVLISYFDGATSGQKEFGLYADASITAAPDNFSYWINDRGEIVSLYPTFEFKAVQDNSYTAVYNAQDIPDAVISVTGIYRDEANDQVTFYVERSSKYTVKKNGIVLTFDPAIAADNGAFVPGGAGVLTGTAKYNTLAGNYAVTKNSYMGEPIFARGYIEIEYPNGTRVTLYSNVISFED